jgi:hypothetical protein
MIPVRVDKLEPYDIFIGRPSKFSNPFKINEDGTRSEVIDKFETYFRNHPKLDELIKELNGKRVACWCNLNERCHFDIILKIIKEKELNKLFDF